MDFFVPWLWIPKLDGYGLLLLSSSLLLSLLLSQSCGQQTYVNNHQLACYDDTYNFTTKGFKCNGVLSSCQSYITFRSIPLYNTPATIAYLLGGAQQTANLIASINNISSDVASIPTNTQVVVPVNCSCYNNQYYQSNATYTLKDKSETYFTVANSTYQGLTTCQALMAQNSFGDKNLSVGLNLAVPLRCACPTPNQTASGFKYLLTYMVTWGDSVSAIAQSFRVEEQSVFDANELSSTHLIFPFTPILVPLTAEPTKIKPSVGSPPPPPASPPPTPIGPIEGSKSNKNKWTYLGVGIGAVVLIIFSVLGIVFLYRRKSHKAKPVSTSGPKTPIQSDSANDYTAIPDSKSWSLSSHGIRHAIGSLTVYKFEDLQIATDHFCEANRIKGSVYRGHFKGDAAAVKVMKGDVSSEINILKNINHFNIIRLSGFCVCEGYTYLVYEYAENGSLLDWLHSSSSHQTFTWKQRVQIAHDVADGLNYLHNYTNPAYIHKNLKTSNILLDANLRGKIANFGLARTLENDNDGNGRLQVHHTRHVVGTQGYMPPEYIENGLITPKLDVFAFGVVILELLSGKEAAAAAKANKNIGEDVPSALIIRVLEGDNVREKLRNFIDPSLKDEYPLDLAFSAAQLAKTCVDHDLNARPSMNQVFMTLSKILSSSLDWDPSDELNRSTSLNHGR